MSESNYLVWSIEHTAWWKPEERGYTTIVEDAGRYTKERADEIAAGPDPRFPRVDEKAIAIDARHERVATANALVRVIAGCGRRFFRQANSDGVASLDRVSRMEIDGRGRLWWVDKYSGHRVYTAYAGRWHHFTEGGTLRSLVECLCAYIKTGAQLPRGIFGPWPAWVCDGDLWGYGAENMATIRAHATSVGILASEAVQSAAEVAV